jgi:hypothetical protein
MFDQWFAAVKEALDSDTSDWGLSNRYEHRNWKDSHEALVAGALEDAGFTWEHGSYPLHRRTRADGVVSHPGHDGMRLRYELKSVFLPHYWSSMHPHNHDYERLLRLEHPNGAIGDIERLRQAAEQHRVFLLLGISWAHPEEPQALARYEQHRHVLLDTFAKLAGLAGPSAHHEVRGSESPWSCDARAWLIG